MHWRSGGLVVRALGLQSRGYVFTPDCSMFA